MQSQPRARNGFIVNDKDKASSSDGTERWIAHQVVGSSPTSPPNGKRMIGRKRDVNWYTSRYHQDRLETDSENDR